MNDAPWLARTVAFADAIDRPFGIAEFAAAVGITRAAANVRLSRAAKEGLVERTGRGVYRISGWIRNPKEKTE